MINFLNKRVCGIFSSFAFAVLIAPMAAHGVEAFKHGVITAKGDAGIIFMPSKFEGKYGIDIKWVQFKTSTTPVKALISGDIDVFTTSPSVALVAMSKGAPLKFIGCNWPGATYTLYGASDVKKIADLKGGSVGVSGPGTMPDLFVRELLLQNGVAPETVTFASAGGGTDRYRALLAGIVKATATTSEFEPDAIKRGMNILARASQAMPKFARNCIVTTDEVIANKGDQLARFLAAHMDGYAYTVKHRDESLALTRKLSNLKADNPNPAFIYDEALREKSLDPLLAIPVDSIQWIEDMLVRQGRIDATKDVKAFISEGPRQAALKLLKP